MLTIFPIYIAQFQSYKENLLRVFWYKLQIGSPKTDWISSQVDMLFRKSSASNRHRLCRHADRDWYQKHTGKHRRTIHLRRLNTKLMIIILLVNCYAFVKLDAEPTHSKSKKICLQWTWGHVKSICSVKTRHLVLS